MRLFEAIIDANHRAVAGDQSAGAHPSEFESELPVVALTCVVKGGKEIAIIGHTDCQVAKTTMMELLDRFRAMGIERHLLPANVNEYFGIFSSERANVIKAVG